MSCWPRCHPFTPPPHTHSYARIPHSTYLAFVLHCVSFIPSPVPGPFKQLDIAALMVGLAVLPGCWAAQHDKRPHHRLGIGIVLRQYHFGRGTFFFFFFLETRRHKFHNTAPDVCVTPLHPHCYYFFFTSTSWTWAYSVCTVFSLLLQEHEMFVSPGFAANLSALASLCALQLWWRPLMRTGSSLYITSVFCLSPRSISVTQQNGSGLKREDWNSAF